MSRSVSVSARAPVVSTKRRELLGGLAALGAAASAGAAPLVVDAVPTLLPRGTGRRVLIVGGGWGGLSAARQLRELAPGLEVVLLERNARFWSGPLSNKWLAGLIETRMLEHDYSAAAATYGYTFIQSEAKAVDRDRRCVLTARGAIDYDWLVLAVGIRYQYEAWFGDDQRAIDQTRRDYPCAYLGADEAAALKRKLHAFAGGELVMALPAMPYRCPPSPYERACMIGAMLKARRTQGRLVVLDPNPLPPGFRRNFAERYRDQIVYVGDAGVKTVDPFNKTVSTEFDDYRFDDAILMPPQQAGDLVWQAGLIARDSAGKPTGWADVDPLHLHARGDERVFLIGDLLGTVSPLFGQYPKSGHLASRQGRIVAREIAARAQGAEPPQLLPDSVCFVFSDFDPLEMIRLETRYRVRGDGLIEQTASQFADPNPRGEDLAWASAMFAEFLAHRG